MKTPSISISLLIIVLFLLQFSKSYNTTSLPPFATSKPHFDLRPVLPIQPTIPPIFDKLSYPYPTSSWITNLGFEGGEAGRTLSITTYPYHVRLSSYVEICYPDRFTLYEKTQQWICPDFASDDSTLYAKMGATEFMSKTNNWKITSTDLLSVTVEWEDAGKKLTSHIVYGSPYAVLLYEALTPQFDFSAQILTVNGGMDFPVTGDSFQVDLTTGERLLIFSSSTISLYLSSAVELKAQNIFTGHIQMAFVTKFQGNEAILTQYKGTYATGADFSFAVVGNEVQYQFAWKKVGSGPLLMMALPHHTDVLINPETTLHNCFNTLKGKMVGIIGDVWEMKDALPSITWTPPRPISQPEIVRSALKDEDMRDHHHGQVYIFGKEATLFARWALIADQLGETDIKEYALDLLQSMLELWLNGLNENKFLYDDKWGSIVTTWSTYSQSDDHGNAWFNDHHFHYGYIIYASAVLQHLRPGWLVDGSKLKNSVIDLLRDYMNPSPEDPYFTQFRHFDAFNGHSWASGQFPFYDGKNQESSSEAVHAYYGAMLLGIALQDKEIQDVGSVLLSMELRSTRKYWHMKDSDPIYEHDFAKFKMVGILWSKKVDFLTFFGHFPIFVFGIQTLPVTPMLELLISESFARESYHIIKDEPLDFADWCSLRVAFHAIFDPVVALPELDTCTDYMWGASRTTSLYWILTRP